MSPPARSCIFSIRIAPKERAALLRQARRQNTRPSDLARTYILTALNADEERAADEKRRAQEENSP